jgi:hypothetical protein
MIAPSAKRGADARGGAGLGGSGRGRVGGAAAPAGMPREHMWVALLLAAHAALALWGAARNSVTFDENFHVPAGALIAARANYAASFAQPPLAKTLEALPALAMGARLPPDSTVLLGEAGVGEAFMRLNAARYHALYFGARLVAILFSLALAWLVWRFASRLYGPRAARLALALYAFAPEALAHAGIAGIDMATALGFTASIFAFWRFTRTTRWRDAAWLALALGLTALTRFSAIQLGPILLLLAALAMALGRLRRARRVWLVLACLPVTSLIVFDLGYLNQTSLAPLRNDLFFSQRFEHLQRALPALRPPIPDQALRGLDYLSYLAEGGRVHAYFRGEERAGRIWSYFPVGLAVKWPLGFIGVIALRAARRARERLSRKRVWNESVLLLPAAIMLASAALADLNVGIRYVFPILPLLCVWCGGLLASRPGVTRSSRSAGRKAIAVAAVALAVAQGAETLSAAPWYLAFFNRLAGGTGGGYEIVNDSNVDWGQGLIALRDEMKKRGITKIHLAYHGTTDPAVYGIDYVPYLGGAPGPECAWLAVSSYYFVGLGQKMMTPHGRTERLRIDFGPLRRRKPDAVLAGCLYLFRLR